MTKLCKTVTHLDIQFYEILSENNASFHPLRSDKCTSTKSFNQNCVKSSLQFKLCHRLSQQSGTTHLMGSNLKSCQEPKLQDEEDVNRRYLAFQKCKQLNYLNSSCFFFFFTLFLLFLFLREIYTSQLYSFLENVFILISEVLGYCSNEHLNIFLFCSC